MRYFKIILFFLIFILLNNCTGFRDAMTGQNKKTTDEFLVKKKDPLIMPPEYDKLPVPKSKEGNDSNSLKSIFSNSKDTSKNSKVTSDLEKMILKELRK